MVLKAAAESPTPYIGLLAAGVTDTISPDATPVETLRSRQLPANALHSDSSSSGAIVQRMKTSPILVQTVADRLNAAIGVDPRGLDAKRLQWIIGSRCRHLNLPDASAYGAYLEETPGEIDALIDEVVVRETRFFRDLVVFDHIRQTIAQLATAEPGPLRILSAPCGTGEEAYSLAAIATAYGSASGAVLDRRIRHLAFGAGDCASRGIPGAGLQPRAGGVATGVCAAAGQPPQVSTKNCARE